MKRNKNKIFIFIIIIHLPFFNCFITNYKQSVHPMQKINLYYIYTNITPK